MGGELKRILEGQRQLEEQFNQLTLTDDSSGVQQLREHAHSINASTQGKYCCYCQTFTTFIMVPWDILTVGT